MEEHVGYEGLHFVLSADAYYGLPAAVTMFLMLKALPDGVEAHVHFIDGGVSEDDKARIRSCVDWRATVHFYGVERPLTLGDFGFGRDECRYTDTILLRIHLAEVLPDDIDRVIYLDSDTLVKGDLSVLWKTDLAGKCVGAAVDYFPQGGSLYRAILERWFQYEGAVRCFNSGVVLIDLDRWRELNIGGKATELWPRFSVAMSAGDQDILNLVLLDDWYELESKWNYSVLADVRKLSEAEARYVFAANSILHFTGQLKPWMEEFPRNELRNSYREFAREIGWALP